MRELQRELLETVLESQAQRAAYIEKLAAALSAPKALVFDGRGRPVGVETVQDRA